MVASILKAPFPNQNCHVYNKLHNKIFRAGLEEELSNFDIHNSDLEQFSNTVLRNP